MMLELEDDEVICIKSEKDSGELKVNLNGKIEFSSFDK